jgi:hypothetical protein
MHMGRGQRVISRRLAGPGSTTTDRPPSTNLRAIRSGIQNAGQKAHFTSMRPKVNVRVVNVTQGHARTQSVVTMPMSGELVAEYSRESDASGSDE